MEKIDYEELYDLLIKLQNEDEIIFADKNDKAIETIKDLIEDRF